MEQDRHKRYCLEKEGVNISIGSGMKTTEGGARVKEGGRIHGLRYRLNRNGNLTDGQGQR